MQHVCRDFHKMPSRTAQHNMLSWQAVSCDKCCATSAVQRVLCNDCCAASAGQMHLTGCITAAVLLCAVLKGIAQLARDQRFVLHERIKSRTHIW